MSRYLDRVEERQPESGPDIGLSRSGAEERPRTTATANPVEDFGANATERVVYRDREFRIRPSAEALIRTLGTFRVVREADLIEGVYGGREQLALSDLKSMRCQGLVRSITFHRLGDEAVRVHTLTGTGHRFVADRNSGPQFYYWGVVRPSEVHHDALLYRAFIRERDRIREGGGTVKRVVLDAELKSEYYRRLKKAEGQPYQEVQRESAAAVHLPVVNGRVVFPDFRIECENERGEAARVDVEVATGNYREGQIATKLSAGFRVYSTSGAGLGVRVESGGKLRGHAFPLENRSVLSL